MPLPNVHPAPVTVGHEIIMAAAGTGKTFALTGRLITLLALGVPLERIVALTFTRAAAGEMFDKLVTRLAAAAAAPEQAQAEAKVHLGLPHLCQADFARLLRAVTARHHLSAVGTLDSFFVRIIRLFPFELGLGGEFALLEGQALAATQQRVLRTLLRAPATAAAATSRSRFLEAFKRATFGAEGKALHTVLEGFVNDYHDCLLNSAVPDTWGDPACIWPERPPWWQRLPAETAQEVAASLRRGLEETGPTPAQRERWEAFLELAGRFAPGSLVTKPGDDLFGKLLAARGDLAHGSATLTVMRRRVELGPELCAAVLKLVGHVAACLVESRLEATRGVRDILERYEAVYEASVRRRGRLAFRDVTEVLSRGSRSGARLAVDYRLDGRYDHWALDEFQDTSRAQWSGVQPLIDEAIQDPGGQRSFFAVGDVKQAIYGWRGGDARLLGEVARHYRLPCRPLTASFRCGPAVIAAVNRVFGGLAGTGLPATVRERWDSLWAAHASARPERTGVAELCEVAPGAAEQPPSAAWFAAVAARLEQVRPWERGLSAAVLVRRNLTGAELTEALRRRGIPAVWTGDKAIADNPVVAVLLDLFRFAEHPGDTAAWQHLLMSPLRAVFGPDPENAADAVALAVLQATAEQGFAPTLEHWIGRLASVTPLDAFSRQRLRALVGAAEAFDRTGNHAALDFVDFVTDYTVADLAVAGMVHVMTVHRSKGLGFDLVLLPLFADRASLDGIHADEVICGGPVGDPPRPAWLLLAPPKAVACTDPVLEQALVEASAEAAFGELCGLYVGMTRAARALHVLVPPPPKSAGGGLYLHTLVRQAWAGPDAAAAGGGVLARFGDPEWYQALPLTAGVSPGPAAAPTSPPAGPPPPRRRRSTPSQSEPEEGGSAGDLFTPGRQRGLAFGSSLHACFEQVEWTETAPADPLSAPGGRELGLDAELARAANQVARRALATPEFRAALSRPAGPVELWRERSFEVVLDDEWISGTFDRVVLRRAPGGEPVAATILDFKSDRIDGEAGLAPAIQRHTGQMRLYRQVLARLTGLSPGAITCQLAFTHPGRVVTLDFA